MAYETEVETTDGNTETHRQIRGLKPVAVFGLAQTDGKELPEICTRLGGEDDDQLFAKLVSVAGQIGFSVEHSDELGAPNGDCNFDLNRIRVKPTNSPAQQVKTLAHELGHAILHRPGEDRPTERALIELEAESVAYIVCSDLGIASDGYTFGYVASWGGVGDEGVAVIKASGSRIQKAADKILQSGGECSP